MMKSSAGLREHGWVIAEKYFDGCELYHLPARRDDRGVLVAIEGGELPFAIQRVYYLYGVPLTVARGFHAHRELDQIAICLAGGCTVVADDGRGRRVEVAVDAPDMALRLGPLVWHEMRDFTKDCVFLVLASGRYDESDYIRDYGAFLARVG